MKRTSIALAIVLPLIFVAGHAFAQRDQQGRGQARGGQTQERARPRHPDPNTKPPAAHRTPERPRGTTGTLPRVRPHAPTAQPRLRVYPEPRFYAYEHPRAIVPTIVYPRPYFVFRPWLWLGFGVYIGYPVPYPLVYGPPEYVYGDGVISAAPAFYGGVSLKVFPEEASVIVDGAYVGLARDFGPTRQPLTLTVGRHHIELEAAGLEPLAFDVDIIAGQVVPFSGRLQRE